MNDYQALAGPVLIVFFALLGGFLMGWALRDRHDEMEREWNMTHSAAWRDRSEEPTGV